MRKHFAILVSVFFFWGFVAASNDILIPVFQSKLQLEQWQSQMISFIFYVAYTVGALGYLLLTRLWGKDLVATVGYGKSLGIGLWISALGTLLFIPAANQASFPLLLAGLLVVGLGFSLQQTVANPLAIALGTPETGSQRLSMAGGVNNLGTTGHMRRLTRPFPRVYRVTHLTWSRRNRGWARFVHRGLPAVWPRFARL